MIDTRIKTFLTLCRRMNYRRTAEELHMTQPAVTQQIQFLEQEYGCRLFIYDKRTLSMTPEARVLQAYAENVIYQENKARDQLREAKRKKLSIGATKTIGEYVIADQITDYLQAEGNSLSVEVDNTERLLEGLSAGKLDFALIEGFFDRGEYACKLYRQEPFVGICEADHPFAGKKVAFDDLWGEHLLIREEGSGTRDIFEQMLKEHNHSFAEFRTVTEIGNFGLMTQVLRNVHGITFAYHALLGGKEDLREFQIRGSETAREFNYVFLDNPFAREAVEYFDSFRRK